VIQSFKDQETEKIFNREMSLKLDHSMQHVAYRKLRMLHNAHDFIDLNSPPSNHLEKLKGKREGMYSIRINDQYRICFEWHKGNAYQVEIVDYH
jgi:proteic killer suppression protein